MGSYDPQALLAQIDEHTAPILIGFGLAMVCQTVVLVDAVRMGARERVIAIPLFCTFFWFAHDLGCVVRFDTWFNTYDHWFLQVFWVGLLSAMLLEFVFFAQAIRYGREELLPSVSTAAFAALIALGAVGTIIAWEYLREVVDDPLYQVGPPLTMLAYPLTGAALVMRRRSAAGQTVRMWTSFAAMAVFWWTTTVIWFAEPPFRSWPYIAAGVATVAGCLGMARVVGRLRAAEPQPAEPVLAAAA
jgi:surface polysaccharide O-acyltransferase-like enzyme